MGEAAAGESGCRPGSRAVAGDAVVAVGATEGVDPFVAGGAVMV